MKTCETDCETDFPKCSNRSEYSSNLSEQDVCLRPGDVVAGITKANIQTRTCQNPRCRWQDHEALLHNDRNASELKSTCFPCDICGAETTLTAWSSFSDRGAADGSAISAPSAETRHTGMVQPKDDVCFGRRTLIDRQLLLRTAHRPVGNHWFC